MRESIELQVISRILTSDDEKEVNDLCQFDSSYYAVYKDQISFILEHQSKFGNVPDVFTFQSKFETVELVTVKEPFTYLARGIKENKCNILLTETFNKLKDLGNGDVKAAWKYLSMQCDRANSLSDSQPTDIIHNAVERANQVKEYAKQERIPTGFAEIDKLMYGGLSTVEELLLILARTGSGKAQPLWSKVLTPTGWTTMGELKVGDVVVGENNDNGRIVQIFPQGEKDYYRVNFNDGTFAECCGDHLWKVLNHQRRRRDSSSYEKHLIMTTDELRESLDKKYTVDISEPIEFDVPFDEDSELDGYLLGVYIGDGCTRDGSVTITNESDELWSRIESILPKYKCHRSDKRKGNISIVGDNLKVNYIKNKLIEYGLFGKKSIDKFIPKQYFTAPIKVRMALLAGLVDTDGFNSKIPGMSWEFDTASEQLAEDFAELARSLGVYVKVHSREESYYIQDGVRKQANGTRHMYCRSVFNPFYISTKANRYFRRTTPAGRFMPRRHAKDIVSIDYVGKTKCQCILLDNQTHTYITNDYIVTHNTWVCTKIMESAQRNGFPVLYYSPEMQASYMGTRFDTWRGHFQNSQLIQGKYSEQYEEYLKNLSEEIAPAFIVEDVNMSEGVVDVQGLSVLVKKFGIKLVIIDGLSYMSDSSGGKNEPDHIKYKNICADLFRMSKRYGCAVVVAVQANRETRESKDDKGEPFPNLYNIESSDHPARICTQAFALRQIFDKHVIDIRLEKARMANNQRPIVSYAWDINTGNMQYLPGDASEDPMASVQPPTLNSVSGHTMESDAKVLNEMNFEDEDDVEF